MPKIACFFIAALFSMHLCAGDTYLTHEQFLQKAFGSHSPVTQTLWLKPEHKIQAEKIMQRRFKLLRVRYWQHEQKTAWILDEIGKEKPITIGIIIGNNNIESVDILAFRESRGWEIRHSFFTKQFQGLTLLNNQKLSKPVDGISGATLSVSAVKRSAALALYLAQQVTKTE